MQDAHYFQKLNRDSQLEPRFKKLANINIGHPLKLPRAAHRLVDVAVGVFVVDEALLGVVESQAATGTQRNLGQVHYSTGTVSVAFIESKFLPLANSFYEVSDHRLRLRELRQFFV